jgi:hypothetical protein
MTICPLAMRGQPSNAEGALHFGAIGEERGDRKRNIEISSRLIPLVDDLTHILIEVGKNKLQ